VRSCYRGSSENGSRAASNAVAEIHACYVVAGNAFKVVLLSVFGLDESVPGGADQCVAARAAARCGPSVRFANL
jgi:hypothetical protein